MGELSRGRATRQDENDARVSWSWFRVVFCVRVRRKEGTRFRFTTCTSFIAAAHSVMPVFGGGREGEGEGCASQMSAAAGAVEIPERVRRSRASDSICPVTRRAT